MYLEFGSLPKENFLLEKLIMRMSTNLESQHEQDYSTIRPKSQKTFLDNSNPMKEA